VGITEDHVFILDIPGYDNPKGFKTIQELVDMGRGLPELEKLNWSKGQGARQAAFLCYSSGTSGLPVCFRLLTMMRIYGREKKKEGQLTRETESRDGLPS
jgi:acyl-CoA synthetase (AMP-forming)/AMP-acid ligase II